MIDYVRFCFLDRLCHYPFHCPCCFLFCYLCHCFFPRAFQMRSFLVPRSLSSLWPSFLSSFPAFPKVPFPFCLLCYCYHPAQVNSNLSSLRCFLSFFLSLRYLERRRCCSFLLFLRC